MTAAETDHDHYARDTFARRSRSTWPNGAQAACAIVVNAEYYEMQPPAGAFIPPNVPGGFGRGPYPDFRNYSARAYGNRVGIFRIFAALAEYELKASVALDSLTAELCPQLVAHIARHGFDVVAHGQSATRVISAHMTEEQERDYIRQTLETIRARTGTMPQGWHGPEYGESRRTPGLLAMLGVKYVLDWPNDEQPIDMTTPHGPLVSIPMLIDLDDVHAQFHRKISSARWRMCVEDAVEQIVADGQDGVARLLVVNLHPWLSGHPCRIGDVEALFRMLAKRRDIWLASTDEIAAHWTSRSAEGTTARG
ncbi:MAG: polysaccharide deacetylase family protein [Rhodospirillales bacterium]|nr:polysaccharide deacetylase family protein [Rhodospirillales bacterium]